MQHTQHSGQANSHSRRCGRACTEQASAARKDWGAPVQAQEHGQRVLRHRVRRVPVRAGAHCDIRVTPSWACFDDNSVGAEHFMLLAMLTRVCRWLPDKSHMHHAGAAQLTNVMSSIAAHAQQQWVKDGKPSNTTTPPATPKQR